MTKNGFKDTRLLEALDYIDQDLIGEVAVKLKFEESAPLTEEPVMTWKTPFKHWKRMLATVACLLLLSAAFPVLDYAVQRFGTGIWEGNAGAGESSNIELNEYGSPYERAIDAYPEDMPAEEIYADVLKGGWVVKCSKDNSSDFIAGGNIWEDFYKKSNQSLECSVLLAHYTKSLSYECIFLTEIVFNGGKYYYRRFNSNTDTITPREEYTYLIKDFYEVRLPPEVNKISGLRTIYALTNYSAWTYSDWLSLSFGSQLNPNRSDLRDCVVIITHNDIYDDSVSIPAGN